MYVTTTNDLPGFRVTRHDRPLDRGSPTPARQKGAMQVETPQTRGLKNGGLQDLAIGDDAGRIERMALGNAQAVPVKFGPPATGQFHAQPSAFQGISKRPAGGVDCRRIS